MFCIEQEIRRFKQCNIKQDYPPLLPSNMLNRHARLFAPFNICMSIIDKYLKQTVYLYFVI